MGDLGENHGVESDAEVLFCGTAQHHRGERIAQHLGGDLVGHRVGHGHRDRGIDVDDLAPLALVGESRDPHARAEAGDPGADLGNHTGRLDSGDQLGAGGLRSRYGQKVTGADGERADPHL